MNRTKNPSCVVTQVTSDPQCSSKVQIVEVQGEGLRLILHALASLGLTMYQETLPADSHEPSGSLTSASARPPQVRTV